MNNNKNKQLSRSFSDEIKLNSHFHFANEVSKYNETFSDFFFRVSCMRLMCDDAISNKTNVTNLSN